MIKAPYNFVPVSQKVFFPDWSDRVSHDIPFSDGESGVIEITITAKSPIFIRDHEKKTEFCQYNGEYYIPGSSIKGMIRNVLEIMSFSKMSFVDDKTYAVRDLRNRKLYMSKMTPEKTFCGFLKKENGEYIIENCGVPGRIRHEEIDKIYDIDFASKFKEGNFGNKAKDKTAKIKYEMINSSNFVHKFEYVKEDANRKVYRYNPNASKRGTLVLTGQPSARKEPENGKPSGKIYEFIFFDVQEELKVSEKVFENFKFAYFDGRNTEPKESPDWTFWKEKLEAGEKIPVFFQKAGKEVLHFGLSYLYKLPYQHSIREGIPEPHKDSRLDLAQTIFGYTDDEKALKGRVQFSHFKAVKNIEVLPKRIEILGTPRASYYPNYVKQTNANPYKTYMDSSFKIAGWKRYPIHKGSSVKETTDTGNENVGTTFAPLKEGVVFKGKMIYHNLRKAELGAVLSALTFHKTEGCFHNIGMAKALGYGKIDIEIKNIDNIEKYLREFERVITIQIDNWCHSEQIKELLTMATEQNNINNSTLEYMTLKSFAKNKLSKEYLKTYTKLDNIQETTCKSFLDSDDLKEIRLLQEEFKKREKEYKEQQKLEQRHQNDWQIAKKSSNITQLKSFLERYPNSSYREEAEKLIKDIKEEEKRKKEAEINKKAKEKWEAIHKAEKKFLKEALIRFINDFPTSSYIEEAKKELEELENSNKAPNTDLDFSQVRDLRGIERVIKLKKTLTKEDIRKLIEKVQEIYPTLNSKKKRQFKKSTLIIRWLSKEKFDEILNEF